MSMPRALVKTTQMMALLAFAQPRASEGLMVNSQFLRLLNNATLQEQGLGATLRALDTNHDGVVDSRDVASFARRQGLDAATVTQEFAQIDLNGDGRLDRNEIARALAGEKKEQMIPPSPAGASAPAKKPARHSQASATSHHSAPQRSGSKAAPSSTDAMSSTERTLMALDMNHDGFVDPQEVAEFARAQSLDAVAVTQEFMEMDANGDGRLDSQEITKALAKTGVDSDGASRSPESSPSAAAFAPNVPAKPKAGVHLSPKSAAMQHAPLRAQLEPKSTIAANQDDVQFEQMPAVTAEQEGTRQEVRAKAKKARQQARQQHRKMAKAMEDAEREKQLLDEKNSFDIPNDDKQESSIADDEKNQQQLDEKTRRRDPSTFDEARDAESEDESPDQADMVTQSASGLAEEHVSKSSESEVVSSRMDSRAGEEESEGESVQGGLSSLLRQEETWEAEAQVLEQRAAELRLNASFLAKSTARLALDAGARAARSKTTEILQVLSQLESSARKADVTAAALKAKAQTEAEEAGDLMIAADAALGGEYEY